MNKTGRNCAVRVFELQRGYVLGFGFGILQQRELPAIMSRRDDVMDVATLVPV